MTTHAKKARLPKNKNQWYLSLGSGLRLVSEDILRKAFRMDRANWRRFARCLRVPYLIIGNTRLHDLTQIVLVLKYAMRVGQPNFIAPHTKGIKDKLRKRTPGTYRTQVDVELFRRDLEVVIAELLYSKDLLGFKENKEAMEFARGVADRLILLGLATMPSHAQSEYEKAAVQSMFRRCGKTPAELLAELQLRGVTDHAERIESTTRVRRNVKHAKGKGQAEGEGKEADAGEGGEGLPARGQGEEVHRRSDRSEPVEGKEGQGQET